MKVCILRAELGLAAPIQRQPASHRRRGSCEHTCSQRRAREPSPLSCSCPTVEQQQLSQYPVTPPSSPLCSWVQVKVPMAGSKAGKGHPCL